MDKQKLNEAIEHARIKVTEDVSDHYRYRSDWFDGLEQGYDDGWNRG